MACVDRPALELSELAIVAVLIISGVYEFYHSVTARHRQYTSGHFGGGCLLLGSVMLVGLLIVSHLSEMVRVVQFLIEVSKILMRVRLKQRSVICYVDISLKNRIKLNFLYVIYLSIHRIMGSG